MRFDYKFACPLRVIKCQTKHLAICVAAVNGVSPVFCFPCQSLRLANTPGTRLHDSGYSCTPQARQREQEMTSQGSKSQVAAVQASRPKLALWRSARERGIWMQDMAAAQLSTSAAVVAYLAAVLSDKSVLALPLHTAAPTYKQALFKQTLDPWLSPAMLAGVVF